MSVTKKIIICSIFALATIACGVHFTLDLSAAKAALAHELQVNIEQYFAQQKFMLQRLANNLIPAIKRQDVANIAQQLSTYEEIIFALSKQNLAIPVNLHLVPFNGQQPTIGSFGITSHSLTELDEDYYAQAVEHPEQLALSKLYINQAMPEYPLLNLGVGVVDDGNNYHGHLDVQLAVNMLHDYIQKITRADNSLFSFRLSNNLQPEVRVIKLSAWLAFTEYALVRFAGLALVTLAGFAVHTRYRKNSAQNLLITNMQTKLVQTEQKLAIIQTALELQTYYGKLQNLKGIGAQVIDLQQLLNDVKAVNALCAMQRSINLKLPEYGAQALRFNSNKLRIMQILSGILYELIMHNNSGGTIELVVAIKNDQYDRQQIEFTFSDDGFYDKLQAQEYEVSLADVRCKGWHNIVALVELEDGTLEHVHTAYLGNSVSFKIARKLISNVISLEAFLDNPLYET